FIGNYISKYPNQQTVKIEDTVAYFWTMRDINALKRSKTFIDKESVNTIRVTKENLHYYKYVDIFKKYIPHIPYYFGNSDVFINNDYFLENQNIFVEPEQEKLDVYFRELLGEHYV
ncbi:MAG: SAM-dependent methyltransferase, partial [Firmicutes bacterium]|nr:SAM-dependent methyltransferase [Bacillota bacterium]